MVLGLKGRKCHQGSPHVHDFEFGVKEIVRTGLFSQRDRDSNSREGDAGASIVRDVKPAQVESEAQHGERPMTDRLNRVSLQNSCYNVLGMYRRFFQSNSK